MTRLDEIKIAIEKLSLKERAELARWLHGWTDDRWDRQIAADTEAGRLDKLLHEVDAESDAGIVENRNVEGRTGEGFEQHPVTSGATQIGWSVDFASLDAGRHVSLSLLEREEQLPSIRFRIELRDSSESGERFEAVCHVWVCARSVDEFLTALDHLEQTRVGAASLQSMSPNELVLTLGSIAHPGHICLRLSVAKRRIGPHADSSSTITTEFEIDPSLLAAILRRFRQLKDTLLLLP